MTAASFEERLVPSREGMLPMHRSFYAAFVTVTSLQQLRGGERGPIEVVV